VLVNCVIRLSRPRREHLNSMSKYYYSITPPTLGESSLSGPQTDHFKANALADCAMSRAIYMCVYVCVRACVCVVKRKRVFVCMLCVCLCVVCV